MSQEKCSVIGCLFPHCGRKGMCDRHYRKFIKYGDPLYGKFVYGKLFLSDKDAVKKYIMEKIVINEITKCWEWTRSKNKLGYGTCRIENKAYLAHRIAAHIFGLFEITSKKLVCHKCDNPKCVNPEHLFIGTDKDNCIDKMRKGRGNHVRGEAVNTAKISANEAKAVRDLSRSGKRYSEIANELSINVSTVRDICTFRTWKHV